MFCNDQYCLTYCLNVFPVYDCASMVHLLGQTIPEIANQASNNQSKVPLGLWFPNEFFDSTLKVERLQDVMKRHRQVISTLNAFPYGRFHGTSVKEKVYLPDWMDEERVDYTKRVVELSLKLPLREGIIPISTVPITYGSSYSEAVWENLKEIYGYLKKVHEESGVHFRLLFEPEPGCALDQISNTVSFLEKLSAKIPGANQYIGICIDTCHCAVMQEDPLELFKAVITLGYPVDKIQMSSALKLLKGEDRSVLKQFDEPVYLHQTTILDRDNKRLVYNDLGDALKSNALGEMRVHYHIPLHAKPIAPLRSTSDMLHSEFLKAVACEGRILEIETYTFSVLPDGNKDIIHSIQSELSWMTQKLERLFQVRY